MRDEEWLLTLAERARPVGFAAIAILTFGILPCTSGPVALGCFFGWPWGLGAFVLLWGAFGLYQLRPTTPDPNWIPPAVEADNEENDDVS